MAYRVKPSCSMESSRAFGATHASKSKHLACCVMRSPQLDGVDGIKHKFNGCIVGDGLM